MAIEFECGVAPERLKAWFAAQRVEGCTTTLEPLEQRTLGCMALPRTLVHIAGNPASEQELYQRFRLQFMSAGG